MIDFPTKTPDDAKAFTEELPPLMPDFAKVQDDLGTVHFSRFMVEGDEKLLFLSDIDDEVDQHIERLVERAGPVLDAIFKHVDHPPVTPVAGNQPRVIKWLKRHVREPIDTYFAYDDASVQDIKACAQAAGFTGNTAAERLAYILDVQVASASLYDEAGREGHGGEKGHEASDAIGTLHVSHFVPFENNHLGFFTIFDGDFAKYIQDFADKNSLIFDTLFPHVVGAPPTPVAKNARRSISGHWRITSPPLGFIAGIRASRC